jgi:hypothetical protein
MKIWEVTYVTYTYKDKNGRDIEKIKDCIAIGKDVAEAERDFLNKDLKFKKIKSIVEDVSNTIGNNCPELMALRNQIKK